MTFEDWWRECMGWTAYEPDPAQKALAESAWDCQQTLGQAEIDRLEALLIAHWTGDLVDLYFALNEKYPLGLLKAKLADSPFTKGDAGANTALR